MGAVVWAVRWVGRHGMLLGLWVAWLLGVGMLGGAASSFGGDAGAPAWLAAFGGSSHVWVYVGGVVPLVWLLVATVWASRSPKSYRGWVSVPWRRLVWSLRVRMVWTRLCRDAGIARQHLRGWRQNNAGDRVEVRRWIAPALLRVRTTAGTLRLLVRVRAGGTLDDIADGAGRLAAGMDAVAHTVVPVPGSGSRLWLNLVMVDELTTVSHAPASDVVAVDDVPVGRRQSGEPWLLRVRGRHTLIVGCSGAGKASVMWSILAGLAPAVGRDTVQLWGCDLKHGVELAMADGLFFRTATTPADTVKVLRDLVMVMEARGRLMAGTTRLHEPCVGDPLHVLVIDELAMLTAYTSDRKLRDEACGLLNTILTQGRALGVVVIGAVQDPRKETVGNRGLFTQTIALRLRAPEETRMVLGDGMAELAPAHKISPTQPGTAYLVDDGGAVERVRAHWVTDQALKALVTRHNPLPNTTPVVALPDPQNGTQDVQQGVAA